MVNTSPGLNIFIKLVDVREVEADAYTLVTGAFD
jgi:hypothetical protein